MGSDDYGGGEGIANPLDPSTGPDVVDNDDDNDSREDNNFDHLEKDTHHRPLLCRIRVKRLGPRQ